MRRKIKLPAPSSNGNIGDQELYGPIGLEVYRLEGIVTDPAAPAAPVAITDFTNIRPIVNNNPVWDGIDGIDLDEINKLDGMTAFATSHMIVISFELENFIDANARMATSLNTGVKSPATGKIITNWGLKYTIASAGSIQWYAIVEDADPVGPGYIQRLTKKNYNYPGGGADIDNLPYGDVNNAQIRRLLMYNTGAATISDVTVKVGSSNAQWIEKYPKVANDTGLADNGKVPGAYFDFALDFTERRQPDYLTTYAVDATGKITAFADKSFKVNANNTAGDTLNIIANTLGEID